MHHLVKEDGIEYYTIDGMSEIHSEMLRLLEIINDVAEKNNIPYWIAGGSMIGIARHHGFIPWDDDLDIELLKSDYVRLIECLTEYCKKNNDSYLFFPAPQSYHCCNYFASKKYFLRSQGTSSIYPVKVDIRPYNCIQKTKENIEENKKVKDIANFLVFGKSYGIVEKESLLNVSSGDFFRMYNIEYGFYDPQNDDAMLVPPYYEYSMEFEFKYSHLFPLVKVKFGDTCTYLPKEYDYILKSIYGDYMSLPQLHHRVPAACKMYKRNVPAVLYKNYFGSSDKNKLVSKIYHLAFLLYFHGVIDFIKTRFFEKKVEIDTNYKEANW